MFTQTYRIKRSKSYSANCGQRSQRFNIGEGDFNLSERNETAYKQYFRYDFEHRRQTLIQEWISSTTFCSPEEYVQQKQREQEYNID